jgi:hypothetical protein
MGKTIVAELFIQPSISELIAGRPYAALHFSTFPTLLRGDMS